MMNVTGYFRINTPTVVHEIFEHEVVAIHLDSGNYYSLNKNAAQIWSYLAQTTSTPEIVTALVETHQSDVRAIEQAVNRFLADLQQEQLIVSEVAPSEAMASPTSSTRPFSPRVTIPFELPLLRKYTDMQNLLLLDPIHDVDETGWPHVKHS